MFERVNGGGSLRVRDPRAMTDAELWEAELWEAREVAAFGDRWLAELERERDRVRRERDSRLVRVARRVPSLDSTGSRTVERAGLLVGVAAGVVWGVAGVVWDRVRGR